MTHKSRGFTLIELLIVVVLLSLLLFTGTYMYQLLASRWETQLNGFNKSQEFARNLTMLNRALNGIYPFVVRDLGTDNERPAFLFVGFEDRLLGVTRTGLYSAPYPEIFRLSVEETEAGKLDLIYQSVSTEDVLLLTAQQEIQFTNRHVLLTEMDSVELRYFGWQDYIEQSNSPETKVMPTWMENYSSVERQLLPTKLIMSLVKEDKQIDFLITLDRSSIRWITPYLGDFYDT